MDGSDLYTLPVIVDHSTNTTVGDSFDIALYLDRQYVLFPASLHRAFNKFVDQIFTNHAQLVTHTMPYNPETTEISKAHFCRRFGRNNYDEFRIEGEARAAMQALHEAGLGELAGLYVRRDEEPFLEGAVLMYADFIVGGWLYFLKESLAEWPEVRGWHDGFWGTVHDALSKYTQIDS